MKRFTETEKWRDPWFQGLSKPHRSLWLWLCDRVDNAGVVDICWPILNAEIGENLTAKDMEALGDRVEHITNGKWWIPRFVAFQFGELSEASKVHQTVIKLLEKHGLADRVGHRVGPTHKEKEEDKDKERRAAVPHITDEEWLAQLRQNEAYAGIDIDDQMKRMDAWLSCHKGRQKTRRFIVNWLNKVEKPVATGGKKLWR
jgi:hypothetical protein